jgi:hypothetical protein
MGHAPGTAGGADGAGLAGKRYGAGGVAGRAAEQGQAAADLAAREEVCELVHHEAREAKTSGGLLGVVEEGGEVVACYSVENGVFGPAGRVANASYRPVMAAGEGARDEYRALVLTGID